MNSVVALLVVGLVGSALAAPSGLLGVGVGHGVPLATSALVAGPSGLISSHQSNGAIAVAAPAVVAASPAVVGITSLGLGHGLGLGGIGLGGIGLGGIGLGNGLVGIGGLNGLGGLGGLGLGLGHGIHGL